MKTTGISGAWWWIKCRLTAACKPKEVVATTRGPKTSCRCLKRSAAFIAASSVDRSGAVVVIGLGSSSYAKAPADKLVTGI